MPYYEDDLVTLHHGDCLDVLRAMPDCSVDSVVTDPPYGLANTDPAHVAETITRWVNGERDYLPGGAGFMGKAWDAFVPPVAVWDECLRVLKPGGHVLAFAGSRTVDLMTLGLRLAGFEIRDSVAWLYGCLSDDTEILTSEGWVRYDRATEGQHALAFDTATGALAWQAIQHVHRYPYAGEMVRLHSEHTDQLLTPNHRVVLDEGRPTPHTPYVPSEQELRRLLADVPGARPLPVGAEADVLAGVRGSADLAAEEGQGQAPLGAGRPYGAVRDVRDGDVEAGRLAQADRGGVLLEPMQRRAPGGGVGEALPQGQGGMDRRQPGVLSREDDRAEQPRMEGRRYRVQEARELRRSAVRASAGMGATDGPQGRVHHGAPATDGRPLRVPADQAGSHQPRESRPQGQPTRESDPLALEPGAQALRVGEDGGGRLLPSTGVTADVVDYAGVVWCITVPHGAFIARRNGLIFATGNSGFPKSLDVSKAIDKRRDWSLVERLAGEIRRARADAGLSLAEIGQATLAATDGTYGKWYHRGGHMFFETGRSLPSRPEWEQLRHVLPIAPEFAEVYDEAEREVLRETTTNRDGGSWAEQVASGMFQTGERTIRETAPATPDAERWQGWGTALKPAHEPVVCARKPFNVVPLDWRLVANVHHALAGLLWLSLSPAKRVELSSPSSQVERDGAWCASALVSVALNTSRDGYDETATYSSPATASTSLSIASSWSAILAALSAPMSTSTTSTRSSTTTALRTLNSLLGPVTSQTTMPPCECLLGGSASTVASVESSSTDEWANWLHTLSASAPESAIEGIAVAAASVCAQVAESLSDDLGAGSSAAPSVTTGADASSSPAFEPVVVARKPLSGTVAQTVLAHGTGALNIDGCRVEGGGNLQRPERRGKGDTGGWADYSQEPGQYGTPDGQGRWPANVILDESQAEVLDEQSGVLSSGAGKSGGETHGVTGWASGDFVPRDDSGGASRFFYVAKADQSERVRVDGIAHPTVKPLALMRWLVRLVTPPGGTALEPFAGSGTTVEACLLEGFHCVAIEREADYLPLIVQRIHRRRDPVAAVKGAGGDGGLFDLLEGETA